MRILSLILILLPLTIFPANRYWVGGTGNWNSTSHWATSSNGTGGASVPTSSDDVYFDANSFSTGDQTVTININASCRNIDFSGASNNPTLAGASNRTLTVSGSLKFIAGMTLSFAGDFTFNGSNTHNITSAGQTFNEDVLFNGTGTWRIQDDFNVSDQIQLQDGTLNFNGHDILCNDLNANISGDNTRSLNFGNSDVTITGYGSEANPALDLRGNTSNLIISSNAASSITFNCNTNNNVYARTGTASKTIPDLIININNKKRLYFYTGTTENTTDRITFRDITATQCLEFSIGSQTACNIKTINDITIGDDINYRIYGPHGSAYGTGNLITGDFTIGDDGIGDIYGHYWEIQGDVDYGTDVDCDYHDNVKIDGTFTVASSNPTGLRFRDDVWFEDDVTINGDAIFNLENDTNNFKGILDIDDDVKFSIIINANNSHDVVNFEDDIYIGDGSALYAGDGDDMVFKFHKIDMSDNAKCEMNSGSSIITIGDLSCGSHNTITFNNSGGATTITGTITASEDCSKWIWFKCVDNTGTANISLSSAQTIDYVVCSDLNITSTNLTNNGGVDMDNNTGITFSSASSSTTFYWVGGTTGNPKTFGDNEYWTNPSNWSQTSGNTGTGNSCVPGLQDDVVFDNNSFTDATNTDVDIDLQNIACHNMTWTNVASGVTFDNTKTTTNRSLTIFGNLTFDGSNMTNNFEGTTYFSSHNTTGCTITSNGARFYGAVVFNYSGKTWTIADNMNIEGNSRGDFTIEEGTVTVGSNSISLTDDWNVYSGATFTCGTGTVEFDGRNANSSYQLITNPGNDHFYNITIKRQVNGGNAYNTVRLANDIYIDNNLKMIKGKLEDRAYQIHGTSSGQLKMAAYTRLMVSYNIGTRVSKFPTNYTAAHISLHNNSRVYYGSRLAQEISGVPDYGRLYISATQPPLKIKTLTEAVKIKTLLHIDDYNNFYDDGFQITGVAGQDIRIDNHAILTLGNKTHATTFPVGFSDFDLNDGSTVVYNAGVAQTVKGINATSPKDGYYNLIIRDSVAGAVTKTLNANTLVRGNLTIEANNTFDADNSNDYGIEIKGNWINQGTFMARSADVAFTDSSEQEITSNSSSFNNIIFNNTDGTGITLQDELTVTNKADFTNGIVNSTSANLFVFNAGAEHTNSSDNSFINGPAKKVGNTAFIFPLGKSGHIAEIGISAPSNVNDEFTAEYFYTNPGNYFWDLAHMNNLHHVTSIEYWEISQTVGSSTPSVTLYWHDGVRSDIQDLTDLRVAHWNTGTNKWDNMGGSSTGSTASGIIASTVAFTSYSPITFGTTTKDNQLPITLLEFNANLINSQTNINWTTESEINNDYFNVERSSDGVEFKKIAKINGSGNSNQYQNYSTIDKNPLYGISYYRLHQVDFNGNSTYSNVRVIFNYNDKNIKIYPNPAIDIVTIEGDKIENIRITDISGKEMIITTKIIDYKNIINCSELSRGIYILNFISNNKIYQEKLIIK